MNDAKKIQLDKGEEEKKNMEIELKKIELKLKTIGYMNNVCSIMFVSLVLVPILFYQISAFRKEFVKYLVISVEITALILCLIVFFLNLCESHLKKKNGLIIEQYNQGDYDDEDKKIIDEPQNKRKGIIQNINSVAKYFIAFALFMFVVGEILAVISLFYDFSFNTLPGKSKIGFQSMIDISALLIIGIFTFVSLIDKIHEHIELNKNYDLYKSQEKKGIKEQEEQSLLHKLEKSKITLVFSVIGCSAFLLSLAGRTFFAFEIAETFACLKTSFGIIPVGTLLRIIGITLPIFLIPISAYMCDKLSIENEEKISDKVSESVADPLSTATRVIN